MLLISSSPLLLRQQSRRIKYSMSRVWKLGREYARLHFFIQARGQRTFRRLLYSSKCGKNESSKRSLAYFTSRTQPSPSDSPELHKQQSVFAPLHPPVAQGRKSGPEKDTLVSLLLPNVWQPQQQQNFHTWCIKVHKLWNLWENSSKLNWPPMF